MQLCLGGFDYIQNNIFDQTKKSEIDMIYVVFALIIYIVLTRKKTFNPKKGHQGHSKLRLFHFDPFCGDNLALTSCKCQLF